MLDNEMIKINRVAMNIAWAIFVFVTMPLWILPYCLIVIFYTISIDT